jgi:hypothetical protein
VRQPRNAEFWSAASAIISFGCNKVFLGGPLPVGWVTLSCAAGAAEPLRVSALRVSIVAAEPLGGRRSPIVVCCAARALDTTTRHQRTIIAAGLPAATASFDRSRLSRHRIQHSRPRSGFTKKCCPGGSTPEPPREAPFRVKASRWLAPKNACPAAEGASTQKIPAKCRQGESIRLKIIPFQ